MGQRRKRKAQRSLVSFVTRAVSDKCKNRFGDRWEAVDSRSIARAAVLAVKRGRAKGLR